MFLCNVMSAILVRKVQILFPGSSSRFSSLSRHKPCISSAEGDIPSISKKLYIIRAYALIKTSPHKQKRTS